MPEMNNDRIPHQVGRIETFPKIVMMHSQEDELKTKTKEIYIHLFSKLHELYSSAQIFAMAYQAAMDFENYWIELKTRVNINFEDEIKKYAGAEAVKELKKMTKEKENAKRRGR